MGKNPCNFRGRYNRMPPAFRQYPVLLGTEKISSFFLQKRMANRELCRYNARPQFGV
jgi:hypothetical protein